MSWTNTTGLRAQLKSIGTSAVFLLRKAHPSISDTWLSEVDGQKQHWEVLWGTDAPSLHFSGARFPFSALLWGHFFPSLTLLQVRAEQSPSPSPPCGGHTPGGLSRTPCARWLGGDWALLLYHQPDFIKAALGPGGLLTGKALSKGKVYLSFMSLSALRPFSTFQKIKCGS